MRPVAIGLAVGIMGSLAAGRILGGLLFGVESTDPSTLVAMPLLMTVAALAASYLPARRAARIDPILALRAE